jgi:vacuolar-type H+-ATPase subunit D/Vma8
VSYRRYINKTRHLIKMKRTYELFNGLKTLSKKLHLLISALTMHCNHIAVLRNRVKAVNSENINKLRALLSAEVILFAVFISGGALSHYSLPAKKFCRLYFCYTR